MCFNIPCFRKIFFIPKYPYPSRILLCQIFYCVFLLLIDYFSCFKQKKSVFSYSCWILFGLVNKAGYFPGLLHKFSLPISLRRILEDLYHHASFPLFTLPCPIYSISARLFRANILRFKKKVKVYSNPEPDQLGI